MSSVRAAMSGGRVGMSGVRVDKWLWAARFFKTRSRAKEAIDGGKIHLDGGRVKPSKEIVVGQILEIRQGSDTKIVEIIGLSDQRRDASSAAQLYTETQDSLAQRELHAAQRKAAGPAGVPTGRPNKKDRRLIHQFRDNNLN
jgi:ribosome-associated heat shock protein Hsp15